jgi:hypothetical protein
MAEMIDGRAEEIASRVFDIVDGPFCPLGHVVYGSPQFLALSLVMRSQLVRPA